MVYALLTRSTRLRSHLHTPLTLPVTFTRNKSVTQAIEDGKYRTSDRTKSRSLPKGKALKKLSPRKQQRLERFGPTPAYRKKLAEHERTAEERKKTRGSNADAGAGDEGFQRGIRWDKQLRTFAGENGISRKNSSRFGRIDMPRGRGEMMPGRREERYGRGETFRRSELGSGDGGGEGEAQRHFTGERRSENRALGKDLGWPARDPLTKERQPSEPRMRRADGDGWPMWQRIPEGTRGERKARDRTEGRRSSEGGEAEPSQQLYAPRNNHQSDRPSYDRTGTEGVERGLQRRSYDSRSTADADRGSDRRLYGLITGSARGFPNAPESLPYTTAASEFIYGHSSVLAAIKAKRRKLYRIYVHSRGDRDGLLTKIRAHKLFGVTSKVGDEYLRAMDKASAGRPHNGVVLESSPLPVPPITALKKVFIDDQTFHVALDSQSAEDASVNGKNETYSYKSAGWRHPLILYVDGVLDEGNLGAMARSAYFLGVDAIVTGTHHVAPWSHIALKASAGAAEAIPIFKVGKPADFLNKSAQEGWKIYASNAVPPAPPSIQSPTAESPEPESSKIVYTFPKSSKRLNADHSPVAEHPTILMMGSESTGLGVTLSSMAHYSVGIPHGRDANEVGVDSLNVSAAASLLCYEMLQRPKAKTARASEETLF
ncbi:alpha/beta knot [Plenodomus tracheiphilus IPT5]|uniref:rRNA methyltransferase 1, mitochondrial n=1 Tax=Plenodomus tracheiphilus IPT5 TaxID=1408161 RepID=A0A6A7B698_9PLEO|nr:alpha/beta knot [Plenodomus tracheiphilus IPT5]